MFKRIRRFIRSMAIAWRVRREAGRKPSEDPIRKHKYNPVYEAYRILVKVMESDDDRDAWIAIEEAIGFLGEALAD